MIGSFLLALLAAVLLAIVIWTFDARVPIPGPPWLKGVVVWCMVALACWAIWLLANALRLFH